ncbi:MAG: NAD-dependent deacetylase [Syntrophaceae bacterium]|nr:NAD-dependent deacetylase [Syntrophaceae bacterium]
MDMNDQINRAARALREADALLVTAGAGMGVDSGLPDFRGNEGFWKAYPPMAKLGVSFVEMANPLWFERDPSLAWGFYGHRLHLYRRTVPHAGFGRLLEIGRSKREGYFVFTSNVDGQFQKAGYDEDRIEECHGSIHHLQCQRPCSQDIWEARGVSIDVDEAQFRAREPLPRCPRCGALARPNVLMFNDWDWIPHRTRAQGELFHRWLEGISGRKASLAVVELGAGKAVATVRMTSEAAVRGGRGTLIRINPRDTDVPPGHIAIPLGAEEGILEIMRIAAD